MRAEEGVPLASWVAANVRHRAVRGPAPTLFRVSTYSNDPERMSAGAALAQLQNALAHGVLYLDDGWQTLVDGLGQRARRRACAS